MLKIVEQRPYIQGFLDFVSSFMFTEKVTVSELELVESNLDLLKERIQEVKKGTWLSMTILDTPPK